MAVWNAMIDRRPALIARCRDTNDVIATVKFSVQQKLPIAIRGGGHNVAGHAVCDNGVMIDLPLMRNVSIDTDRWDATAFGERSMGWMYSLDGVWTNPADDTANMEWSKKGWTSAERFGHQGRAYLNFPGHGEDGAALTRATFGAGNYQRLVDIKTRYDPSNLFCFNQNIEPEHEST